MRIAHRYLLICSLLSLAVSSAFAAPSDFDSTFGTHGVVKICIGNQGCFTQPNEMAVQRDGRILIAGATPKGQTGGTDWLFARLTGNGSLDTTFNGSGWVDVSVGLGSPKQSGAAKAVLRSDGSILGAGWALDQATGGAHQDVEMLALNDNGSLDTAFGSGGSGKKMISYGVPAQATALGLQKDGKAIVAGYEDQSASAGPSRQLFVFRARSTGGYDPGFATAGIFHLPGTGAATAGSPGSVTFAGSQPVVGYYDGIGHAAILKLNVDGTPDDQFGTAGIVSLNFVQTAVAPPRLVPGLDASAHNCILGLLLGTDGSSYVFRVFSGTGGLDKNHFNSNKGFLKLGFPVADIAVIPNGQVLAVAASGTGSLQLARITVDGHLDSTFTDGAGHSGILTIPFSGSDVKATQVAIQPDGRIVIAGSIDGKAMVARLVGDPLDLQPDPITCASVTNAELSTNYSCHLTVTGMTSGVFVPSQHDTAPQGFIGNNGVTLINNLSAATHGTPVTTFAHIGGLAGPSEAPWDFNGGQVTVSFTTTTQ